MSLLDIFNGFRSGSTVDPAKTVIPSGSGDTGNKDSATGNTTVPSSDTQTSDGKVGAFPNTTNNVGETDPLSGYKDLWLPNTTKTADGKTVQLPATVVPTLTPNMNIDQNKIMEAARTLDFTKAIKPETMEKASKGDIAAFAEVINGIAQNSYAQGILATSGIVQQAMTLQENNFNTKVMPEILRRHTINTTISSNPLSSNPAAAPLLNTIEQQLTAKYPTASPSEIKKHAETYLSGLAEEIVKGNGGTVVTKETLDNTSSGQMRRGETDWEKYFSA